MSLGKTFARNLRAFRKERGITQERLAEISGYSEKYIGRIEQGNRPNQTLAFVEAMAGSLKCDPLDLLRE